ncbi:TrkH family potassium uptake protein [Ilumatobacter nonamiensis]|uniref:TrkH family potassium uptake protein n=1 Tax=Ilumatobacter nonamiensis TaxID=467093 RepID=UPI000347821B|nr:potassium transporter TrkG [Ilumatobacter nonamiensis]
MRRSGLLRVIRNPAQLVVASFALLIAIGTALLFLPWATDGPTGTGWEDALFVSTSATTVTGLSTVPIPSFSLFGELVILALIQIGGFGIMTIGSVFALVTLRRIGLRQRMLAQAEIGAVDIGELKRLLLAIGKITLVVEGSLATILFLRFWQGGYEDGPIRSAYSAVFHAVSAFNNAGISLYPDNLEGFQDDAWVIFPVTFGFIVGGLGFPVYVEILNRWKHNRAERRHVETAGAERAKPWSLHAKITVGATVVLLVGGPLMVLAFEWTNPDTLGPLGMFDKLSNGWFQGVTPRTAGFNTVDIGAMNETTHLGTSIMMFVGAGPASTSGGIKVTTAAVLAAVLWAQIRGETDVNVLRRRIPTAMIRQAVTIALLSIGFVGLTSLVFMASDGLDLSDALFESTSAFGTVGLSTGVTGSISTGGHLVLTLAMICGRVGPLTFVTAIALRERTRLYRHPEERPIIG